MAIAVTEMSPQVFSAMLYRHGSSASQSFMEQAQQQFTNTITDAGRQFSEAASGMFTQLYDNSAMRMAKAAIRKVEALWLTEEIQPLTKIGDLQNAPITMQRWIMACPEVRVMHHEQELDGYSDTYVDTEPGRIGEDHYDYRLARDGMVETTEDGDWCSTEYLQDYRGDDEGLTFEEQLDIEETWNALRDHIKRRREDPTSKYNGLLG